jgi:hypothetical protein
MEEQEAVLNRYFKDHEVKKLMKVQQEVGGSGGPGWWSWLAAGWQTAGKRRRGWQAQLLGRSSHQLPACATPGTGTVPTGSHQPAHPLAQLLRHSPPTPDPPLTRP